MEKSSVEFDRIEFDEEEDLIKVHLEIPRKEDTLGIMIPMRPPQDTPISHIKDCYNCTLALRTQAVNHMIHTIQVWLDQDPEKLKLLNERKPPRHVVLHGSKKEILRDLEEVLD